MMQVSSAIILNDENEILLLKRTKHRKSYPGKWGVMSGTIEGKESPLKCLTRELNEELGVTNFEIILQTRPYVDIQAEGNWLVFPFLCKIYDKIVLDKKEHEQYNWVPLSEMKKYDVVPGVYDDLKKLKIKI